MAGASGSPGADRGRRAVAVTLRLADGRELEGAIVDPISGALVWAPGGEEEVRALLTERHEKLERDFRAFGYARPVFPGRGSWKVAPK